MDSALPAELARSRPRLLLAQAWMALVGGDVEAAGVPLDAAERAFADAATEPFEPCVGRTVSLLANVPAAIGPARSYLAVLHGDAEGTAVSASRALAVLGEGEWVLHSVGLWMLAIAEWVRGRARRRRTRPRRRRGRMACGRSAFLGRVGVP